ncbi:MAG: hypothetical protein A2600_02220 [Candidatus Lambdaproteobacteria bacterium RIFOXYD1_FULL_56_27]|uniref:SbsA Ig-like domain-containing protein n=1 Tax=Candidatus Lambdaproteobacteria bacterium RIFOXYD2_FULL_56_26 TaxID=1817773 RepID=A0A1F6GMP7_9PROT|nr:MAG: hypothetical protein A2557_12210 [Candidatus Lambdaproteobacteria bacterium RIFOXYD2_FULL_56_26]OGH01193.1 MAG: hypothetical protein A2426_03520 [Candidatus Lambdaproteobacteria bacterium RIFOXYC1_FULL_56_13]OGH08614.1 MAG: hypothetical protein A2600_02220 [Candidatus Lambdaproteobacteria bacterium RIFOXYD1_FULL_56_27]
MGKLRVGLLLLLVLSLASVGCKKKGTENTASSSTGTTTSLSLTSYSPADGAASVAIDTSLDLVFNQALSEGALTVTLTGECTGALQLSADDFKTCLPLGNPVLSETATYKVTPVSNLLNATTYKIKVTGLGDEVVSPSGFITVSKAATTTTVTNPAPKVSSTSPAAGATAVALDSTLSVTFDASMDSSTLTGSSSGSSCTGSVQLSVDQFATCRPLTSQPTADSTYKTFSFKSALGSRLSYKIRVTTTAKSGAGVALESNYTQDTAFATVTNVGTLSGQVTDFTSTALSGVTVSFKRDGAVYSSTTTDSLGNYSASLPVDEFELLFTKTGFLDQTLSVTIADGVTTTARTQKLLLSSYTGTGTITGSISDAVSGTGLAGATLNLRSGQGAKTGTVVATATTDSGVTAGLYSFTGIAAGWYTVEVIKTGYQTTYFEVYSQGTGTWANQGTSVTTTLSAGQARILLRWGATPTDLDSYLSGPDNGGFLIYYGSTTIAGVNANLDQDTTSGYGPETITITTLAGTGTYCYYVHNYSGTPAISASGAVVTAFTSTDSYTYYVPNQAGGYWNVFKIVNGVFSTINAVQSTAPSTTCQ